MKTIDLHTHAFPDDLAGRAIAELEERNPVVAVGKGTVASLVASMDEAGIDVSVICAIATKPDQAEGIISWCDAIRSDRIEPFPSVQPKAPRAGKWIERIVAEGFRGIKLHAMYQDFIVDDPSMDEIYAAAEALGLAIAFHAGRDFGFPMDDDRASPARLARVAGRFGRLKMICGHMGGWRMWDESEEHLIGKADVYIETSYSLADLGPARAADMIRRHGVDRVLFGTDWPWARQADDVERLARLHLEQREIEKIAWHNAAELLGL
ncbi:MAG: amidohydrolase family protein [Phycisphaerae bacterium]